MGHVGVGGWTHTSLFLFWPQQNDCSWHTLASVVASRLQEGYATTNPDKGREKLQILSSPATMQPGVAIKCGDVNVRHQKLRGKRAPTRFYISALIRDRRRWQHYVGHAWAHCHILPLLIASSPRRCNSWSEETSLHGQESAVTAFDTDPGRLAATDATEAPPTVLGRWWRLGCWPAVDLVEHRNSPSPGSLVGGAAKELAGTATAVLTNSDCADAASGGWRSNRGVVCVTAAVLAQPTQTSRHHKITPLLTKAGFEEVSRVLHQSGSLFKP